MQRITMTLAAAALAVAAAATAQAATVTFDFTSNGGTNSGSGYGNVRSYSTPDGLTLTVRGFSLLNVRSGNSDPYFTTSQVGFYSNAGLGVCNRDEGTGCSSPNHQIDNSSTSAGSDKDFVLFQFDPAVTISSAFVKTFSSADTDVSYFLGNAANPLALQNYRLSDLGALGFDAERTDTSTSGTNSVPINLGPFNSLLFGAKLSDTNDAFKIQTLVIDYTPAQAPPAVPEPMALSLLASGLVGLGLAARRRRRAG